MNLLTAVGESKSIATFLIGNTSSMQKNRIREDGLEAIEFMVASNPLLAILDLSGFRMGDKGLEILLWGMQVHKSIVSLNVSDNNLSHTHMNLLGEYLGDSPMVELKMGGNTKIGNKGMKLLAKAFKKQSNSLQIVDIWNIGLTFEGVQEFFESSTANPMLQALNIKENDFSLPSTA